MKKITILFLFFSCFASLVIVPLANAQDPNFHIYVCFGQSNMEGQGPIESQDQTVDNRFQLFQAVDCSGQPKEKWRTATPPIARCNTKLGPSDYFGREMIKNLPSNIKVGIVHVSIAGCKIELFDKNNYSTYVNSLSASDQWMKDIINQYGGNPYARLVTLAKLAQKDGVIKGILLHQGESNTGDQNWPTKVKGVYTNLLTDLNLSANNVPLLAGQMVDAAQGGACASMNTIINQLPNTIPTAHIISSAGCTDQADNLHFTSAGYRILGTRYAQMMLSLLSTNQAPVVSLTAPTNNSSFVAPASIVINAAASDVNGTVSNVQFFNGTTLLGSDATAPYSFTWTGVAAGTYSITAKATDNAGAITTSTAISVTVTNATNAQTPFKGSPAAIPGTIQAEEYDLGGEGISFHETTSGNSGNATLRSGDPVDMETTTDGGGGINVGWITAGEWLEYTVNVTTSGTYSLDARVASDASHTFHVELDGVNISGTITVPNTGAYQTFQTVTINNITLTAGQKVMRIVMDNSYFNINYLSFRLPVINKAPSVAITSPAVNAVYTAPASVTITATASDTDGTISNIQFYNGATLLGTDATAPYSFAWNTIVAGTYIITAKATDNTGAITTSAPVTLVVNTAIPVQTPFSGSPAAIPGTIQAESYDLGGEGIAYHETTTGNSGNATLRSTDPVDMETTTDGGGGINVGWIAAGEWLEYTVNVGASGTYSLTARVAADAARTFHIEMNGVPISGTITVPNTGGFQTFQNVTINNINLTAGQKVMRIAMDASYFNLNYITFIKTGGAREGIEETEETNSSAYPNPFDNSVTVLVEEDVHAYTVINMQGITVQEGEVVSKGERIELGQNLSSGLYTLLIQYSSGRTEYRKIRKN